MFLQTINWINANVKYEFLLVGGKYSSLKKDALLKKYSCINFIIIGDGEEALPRTINYLLYNSENLEDIPNLLYIKNETVISNRMQEINIDSLTMPLPKSDRQKIIMYESVRGCVHNCKFCAWSSGVEKFRFKSGDKIYSEWESYINDFNIEEIQVIDSTFLFPNKRTQYLLSKLVCTPVRWKANSRADIPVNKEYVELLEKSGCVSLKFGFESMCENTLTNMNKHTTPNQNRLINAYFKDSKIDTICSFIIGFPGETSKDFNETKEYLLNEHYGHFHLYVFSMEDECMPIWKDKDKFNIKVLDNSVNSFFHHDGRTWQHTGMTSVEAENIRRKALQDIRLHSKYAIHRSWQTLYKINCNESISRNDYLSIERLIDQLTFVPLDYSSNESKEQMFKKIENNLKKYNITYKKEN